MANIKQFRLRVAERITELRKKRGWSLYALAFRAEISYSTAQAMEAGQTNFKAEQIEKIESAFQEKLF